MSKPCEGKAHSSASKKMEKVSGSSANFESQADKADRFCSGGMKYKYGGSVGCEDMNRKD